MKTLYIDCAMGCAGDMLTAALLELHPDREGFIRRMNAVLNGKAVVSAVADKKCGIVGTHVSVLINGEEEGEHEHHHHEHDHEHECCGHDHHHHDHDHECGCGHHHHHADEVFNSIGFDTVKKYNEVELSDILNKLCNDDNVLRAKGFVDSGNEDWWYFDLVPGEFEIRLGKPIYTGQVCVIGKDLDENTIKELFLG